VAVRSTADPATIHALLVDGASWPTWSPLGSFHLEQPGDIRVFRTGRTTSREEVVEVVPGRRFSYALLSGLPLRGYRADVDLEPDSTGTVIHWRSSFRPKVPGTGWLYRLALATFIRRCARGLAAHAAQLTSSGGADPAAPGRSPAPTPAP